jgi:hypothetical protein
MDILLDDAQDEVALDEAEPNARDADMQAVALEIGGKGKGKTARRPQGPPISPGLFLVLRRRLVSPRARAIYTFSFFVLFSVFFFFVVGIQRKPD